MKVYIAVPCLDMISARFAQCLCQLTQTKIDGVDIEVGFNIGTLVYDSRNRLSEQAIAAKADYVLWLDADMVFMPDTLKIMLKELIDNNLDVLTAVYYRRRPPYTSVIYKELSFRGGIIAEEYPDVPTENGILEVAGCGFGCVLMKADILMAVLVSHGTFFSPLQNVGEDLSFCWRVRKCRYKLHCDPTLIIGHEGKIVITKSNRGVLNGNAVKTQK